MTPVTYDTVAPPTVVPTIVVTAGDWAGIYNLYHQSDSSTDSYVYNITGFSNDEYTIAYAWGNPVGQRWIDHGWSHPLVITQSGDQVTTSTDVHTYMVFTDPYYVDNSV